ncbi:MAG: hypothetical protein K2M42_03130 [Oscillospiraceae bacterium]|nr:hypothetical protein [Oscillospiraceae bacterium]
MKRTVKLIWIFALLMALALAGCSASGQELPAGWDESWVRIAEYVGVEPLDGFTLNESNDLLSISGLYYATWTAGDGQDFVNADGDEAIVYDAQIYVLLEECRSADAAQEAVGAWIAREKQSYGAEGTYTKSFGTQSYEIMPLISGGEDNPYTHGTAAFAARDQWAISVEFMCTDSFTGEPQTLLEQFLSGFHYNET